MKSRYTAYIVAAIMTVLPPVASAERLTWTQHTAPEYIKTIDFIDDAVVYATTGGVYLYDKVTGEHDRHTTLDGLPSNDIEDLIAGPSGTIHVHTTAGYAWFDGHRWDRLDVGEGNQSLHHNSFFRDSRDRIWILTYSGVCVVDHGDTIWYTEDNGLASKNAEMAFETSSGDIMIVSQYTVTVFGDNGITCYYPDLDGGDQISDIAEDSTGHIWLLHSGGLSSLHNGVITTYANWQFFSEMTLGNNDIIYCRTNSKELWSFDGVTWELLEFSRVGPIEASEGTVWGRSEDGVFAISDTLKVYSNEMYNIPYYTRILCDSRGRVFLADTDRRGNMSIIDGDTVVTITVEAGWPEDETTVRLDENDVLWIGSNRNGLFSFANGEIQRHYPESAIEYNCIWRIRANNTGACYVLGGYGTYFHVLEGNTWHRWQPPINPPWSMQDIAFAPDGSTWVLFQNDYAARIYNDRMKLTQMTHDIFALENRVLFVDSSGTIWCGHNRGPVSRYDGTSWETFYPDGGGVLSVIDTICEDASGMLWFAGNNEIGRYDGSSWRFFRAGIELPDIAAIYRTAVDNTGVMWLAADTGLYVFSDGNWMHNADLPRILNDRNIRISIIHFGIDDDMWFGTNGGGLLRYDGETWSQYTTEDGLSSNNIYDMEIAANGAILIGTSNGLTILEIDCETSVLSPRNTPADLTIDAIAPNPFNSSTSITWTMPNYSRTGVSVYNLAGQRIWHQTLGPLAPGRHSLAWNGCDDNGRIVSSGTYIVTIDNGGTRTTRKMMFVK